MSSTSSFSKLQELLPQLFQSSSIKGNLYLRCRLGLTDTFLIPMEYVRESLLVQGNQITPVPQMSSCVMGLMTSREKVFCVLDLPQLVGFSPLPTYSRQYHLVVISVTSFLPQYANEQEILLGLGVNQIEGITRIGVEEIFSLEEVQNLLPQDKIHYWQNLTPYLEGWIKTSQKPLALISLNSIVRASL